METKRVTVTAEDGTKFDLVVPTELPTNERAEYLRRVFENKVPGVLVTFLDFDAGWKGRVVVVAKNELADDAVEALEFFGALVDERTPVGDSRTRLFSKGYYAHGF